MTETDLSLVSTNDMIDEIEKRNCATIFATYQDRGDNKCWYHRRWDGGNIPCLGLARFILKRIEEACDEMERRTDEEDAEEQPEE